MAFGDYPRPGETGQIYQQTQFNWDTGEATVGITPESAVHYLEKILKSEIVEYRHQENLLSEELERVRKHIEKLQAQLKAAQMAKVIVRGEAR